MGFNKRYVLLEFTLKALKNGNLKYYYGKSDMLIFEDTISSKIYNLYKEGKTEKEIISLLNLNMEEKTNEMY
jgi:hypothetical protein